MTEDVRDTVAGDAADAATPVNVEATPAPEAEVVESVAGDGAAAGDEAVVEGPAPEGAATEGRATTEASAEGRAPEAPDYKDRWLRTEADLQNFRRRAVRDREESVARAEENVLLDVIGLLDDLERALATMTAEQTAEPWAQGVVLTAQRMRDTLARHGVTPIAAVGAPFDPAVHEALLEVPAPEGIAPGAVAQEVQRGYRRGERALRAARVVVARSGSEG